jgi:kinesin family protein 5
MGIVPRMMNYIFEQIMQADEKIEFTVKVSFIEIYLEKLNDLLDSSYI